MANHVKNSTNRLNIIVTGLVGLHPIGGVAWDYLQYVIGLSRLGHDVYYHEDTWSWPYNPILKKFTDKPNYSISYLSNFFKHYAPDLIDHWHYQHLHDSSFGISKKKFSEIAKNCDVFINVSGSNIIPEDLSPNCVKVFLDTDPGYNQIVMSEKFSWSENVEGWCESIKEHDKHFTYAENIHSPDCEVPKLNINWQTTRMPVVLNLWQDLTKSISSKKSWSTIMTWSAFKGQLIYKDIEYKSKGPEFEKFITLPKYVDTSLEIALGGINAPKKKLLEYGWKIIDGPTATLTPNDYAQLIIKSRGEFSTAKNVYVALKTGWFSCRTACYLASGRPAVVQDTEFSKYIPSGEGLFAFETMAEAVQMLEITENNYKKHCAYALEIAHEYFDSQKILNQFLDSIFLHSPVLKNT